MIRALSVSAVCFWFSAVAIANDSHGIAQEWIKYFEGDWQREVKIWTKEDGWKENEVKWSAELVAGGLTLVTRGEGQWGDFSTTLGINGFTGDFFEYGAAANGNRWLTVFDTIEKDRIKGAFRGGLSDGQKGEGTIEIKRVDKNTYSASWSLKTQDGDEIKGNATNIRKHE